MTKETRTSLAVVIFLGGIIAANMTAAAFGQDVVPLVAFTFIGLDLTLRDLLQLTMKTWAMFAMILVGGIISYMIVPEAGQIAVASASAFTLSALVDWTAFALIRGTWIKRANLSNVVGAVVDSTTFMTIAFGSFMPWEIATSALAKIAGGLFWSAVIAYVLRVKGTSRNAHGAPTG